MILLHAWTWDRICWGGELNFNQSFLKFTVKKKIQVESYSRFDFKCWILDTASLSKIYCYNNANFTIVFLSHKCKVHSVRHISLTYTCVKLSERSEVTWNYWHSWIVKFMNTGKAFPSLDDMACSNPWHDQPQFLPGHLQAKRYWISWDLQTPNLLKKIFITAGIILSLKLKTKRTEV